MRWMHVHIVMMTILFAMPARPAESAAKSPAHLRGHRTKESTAPFASHGFQNVRTFSPEKHDPDSNGSPLHENALILLTPAESEKDGIDIARRFARAGRLVIMVDPNRFTIPNDGEHRACASFSDCLIALSAFTQRRERFSENALPSVLTFGETGSFAEHLWAETPEFAFSEIISTDFCPSIKLTLDNRAVFQRTRWTILESPARDRRCKMTTRPLLGLASIERHSLSADPRYRPGALIKWVNQRLNELERGETRTPASVGPNTIEDLRTIVVEPATATADGHYDAFVVLYSGDGGWAEFTDELAEGIRERRIPVVGINSMRYFWREKLPDRGAQDLERVIRYYSAKWKAKTVHLVGFSFGAGTLPFFARRLPADVSKMIGTVALLAPYRKTDFEFYLTDWFFDDDRGVDVLPEVKTLASTHRPLCIYPEGEKSVSLCTQEVIDPMKKIELPGGHHFNNDIERVVKAVFP